jgi:hypothetical protein
MNTATAHIRSEEISIRLDAKSVGPYTHFLSLAVSGEPRWSGETMVTEGMEMAYFFRSPEVLDSVMRQLGELVRAHFASDEPDYEAIAAEQALDAYREDSRL